MKIMRKFVAAAAFSSVIAFAATAQAEPAQTEQTQPNSATAIMGVEAQGAEDGVEAVKKEAQAPGKSVQSGHEALEHKASTGKAARQKGAAEAKASAGATAHKAGDKVISGEKSTGHTAAKGKIVVKKKTAAKAGSPAGK